MTNSCLQRKFHFLQLTEEFVGKVMVDKVCVKRGSSTETTCFRMKDCSKFYSFNERFAMLLWWITIVRQTCTHVPSGEDPLFLVQAVYKRISLGINTLLQYSWTVSHLSFFLSYFLRRKKVDVMIYLCIILKIAQ